MVDPTDGAGAGDQNSWMDEDLQASTDRIGQARERLNQVKNALDESMTKLSAQWDSDASKVFAQAMVYFGDRFARTQKDLNDIENNFQQSAVDYQRTGNEVLDQASAVKRELNY